MFPIEYSREEFLDGELIAINLVGVTDESHWKQAIDEVTRGPVAPVQYWLVDNKSSFGTGTLDSLRYAIRKYMEIGVVQFSHAMITEDTAYQHHGEFANELAAIEGFPFTATLVGNKEAGLQWFKELHASKRDQKGS